MDVHLIYNRELDCFPIFLYGWYRIGFMTLEQKLQASLDLFISKNCCFCCVDAYNVDNATRQLNNLCVFSTCARAVAHFVLIKQPFIQNTTTLSLCYCKNIWAVGVRSCWNSYMCLCMCMLVSTRIERFRLFDLILFALFTIQHFFFFCLHVYIVRHSNVLNALLYYVWICFGHSGKIYVLSLIFNRVKKMNKCS